MIGKVFITFLMLVLFIIFTVFSIVDNSSKEEKKIRIILNFGIFLIITSSVIFTVSSWESLTNNFKAIFMACETLIFLLFGFALKYLFKIKNTGNSLLLVGSALINVTYLFIGYINIFNSSFNLRGKYGCVYLIVLFIIDLIISILNKFLNKRKSYTFILLSIIPIPFLIAMQITNNVQFSFMIESVFMLILNLARSRLFKNKLEFNIINIIITMILSFIFFGLCINMIENVSTILYGKITIIIYMIALIINAFLYLYKAKYDVLSIFILIYGAIIINTFALFNMNIFTASLLFAVFGIILYIMHDVSNNNVNKIAYVLFSYILALEGIISICFDDKHIILAPIISAIFILLSSVNINIKKASTKVLDIIARIIFVILLFITILLQPGIVDKVKPIDILMLFNSVMLLLYIISSFKNQDQKIAYLVFLMIGLLISIPAVHGVSLIYSIISILIILVLYFYMFYKKNDIFKIISYMLIMLTTYTGFSKYMFYASIFLVVLSILLFIINKDKHKYLYVILGYIPACVLLSNLPVPYTKDIKLLTYIVRTFLMLVPVTILLKRIFNANDIVVQIFDSVLIISMFLSFIFIINVYVAITLGLISIILLFIGYIKNY